ncbi:hypothetical protein DJ568_15495 [Mucilaginibacter hurinus]|uniref:Uncharacterized protein n=1 Tax=Mucilaginibacter hurinus TaxID=2201324 RepID=A0A367GKF1_9SPHI|nr:hypothetical protein [Mucilaginibacter hurinus]RCH53942.1 hypothetical protein DJ568_15495 [Mucilaginibacter hurinus]
MADITKKILIDVSVKNGKDIAYTVAEAKQLLENLDNIPLSVKAIDTAMEGLNNSRLTAKVKDVETYNAALGALKTKAAEAKGEIDAFGDQVPDNNKKKFFEDLNSIMEAGTAISSIAITLGADQAKVEALVAKAMAVTTVATQAKTVAKGVLAAVELAEQLRLKTQIALQTAYNAVVGTSVGVIRAFKLALASTGVGLFLIAIGTLAAYWDEIKEAVSGVTSGQKKLLETARQNTEAEKEKLNHIGNQENVLKLQGKSERDILGMKVKQTEAAITAYENQLRSQGKIDEAQIKTSARNKEILSGIITFLNLPMMILLKTADKVMELLGKGKTNYAGELSDYLASFVFDPEKVAADAKAVKKDTEQAIADLRNQRAGFQLSINQIDKDAAAKKVETGKKSNEDAKKLDEELEKNKLEQLQKTRSANEQEAESIKRKYDDLEKRARGNKDQLKQIAEQRKFDVDALEAKIKKENDQRALDEANEQRDREIETFQKKLSTIKANADEENKLREQILDTQRQKELAKLDLSKQEKDKIEQKYRDLAQENKDAYKAAKNKEELDNLKKTAEDVEKDPNANLDDKFKAKQDVLDEEMQQAIDAANNKEEAILAIKADYKQKTIQLEEDKAAAEKALRDNFLKESGDAVDSLGQILGKQSGLYKAAFRAQQVATVANIVVNTQKEISGIFSSHSTMGPFGTIISIAKAVAAGIRAAKAIAAVKAQKFNRGGVFWSDGGGSMVTGPGSGTSDSINARLSNGETVINARSSAMFTRELNAINVAGGGRPLIRTSAPVAALAAGGVFDGGYSANFQTPSIDYQAMGDVVGQALVRNFPQVYVDVVDVTTKQNLVAKTEERVVY